MPAGGADLLFDQIKIIQQPLGRRRDPPILLGGLGDQVVGVEENPFVLIEPGQKPIVAGAALPIHASRPAPWRGVRADRR